MTTENERYITTWRETGDNVFEWQHYISESLVEVSMVVDNLILRGVHQYATYPIGDRILIMSSAY